MTLGRSTIICLLIALIAFTSGCTLRKPNTAGEWQQYGSQSSKNIGLVLPTAEKGLAGNQAIAQSVISATGNLGGKHQILHPGDLANDRESLSYLAENQCEMIITMGKSIEKDLEAVARQYPETRFAIIGGEVALPNVTSIRFEKSEGSFLAGVLAATLTKTNVVGFVGGSESTDKESRDGFAKGVQYINLTQGKKVKVNVVYAGVTAMAAADQKRGEDLANTLYFAGSDVILSAPGKIANGVANSASQNRKIALGNDPKLVTDMPWNVYAAVTDKQETAVYDLVRKAISGKNTVGRVGYGVAEGAVDIMLSQAVPEEAKYLVLTVKDKMKKGEIKAFTIQIPKDLVNDISQLPVDLNKQPSSQNSQKQNRQSGQWNQSGQNQNQQSGQGNQNGQTQNGQPDQSTSGGQNQNE